MKLVIQYVRSKFNAEELNLYTLPQNKGALGFYSKLGFKPTGKELSVGDIELRLDLK